MTAAGSPSAKGGVDAADPRAAAHRAAGYRRIQRRAAYFRPHPQGEGAIRAIQQALDDAGITPEQVGYINLHGTATRLNDQIEAQVINALFGERVPCSSTKHLTGHTLGAAGITEAAIGMLILQRNLLLPAQDFSQSPQDDTLPPCGLIEHPQPLSRPVILSNSFAFGGNNTSILLGRMS